MPEAENKPDRLPVEIDEYGAFEYILDIVENTIRQNYKVKMGSNVSSITYRFEEVPTQIFVVGEPRIPTAVLELVTPPWVSSSAQ